MEWRVYYQATPFNSSDPAVLVVNADCLEQALATAYDHLTRHGLAVGMEHSFKYDEEKFQSYFADKPVLSFKVLIRRCDPFTPQNLGRVLYL